MKRVLLTSNVLTTQRYGGISRYMIELALGIAAAEQWGVNVVSPVYTNAYLYEVRKRLNHRGIYFNRYYKGLLQLNEMLIRMNGRRLARSCRIVHETFYNPVPLSLVSSGRVSTFYDMMSEALAPDTGVLHKKKLTAQRSDRIIAISESTKGDVVHYLGTEPEKIEVIHLASSIVPQSDRCVHVPDRPYLLWVGGRYAHKNFSGLIRALARSRAFQSDLGLVCAGAGPLTSQERELIADVGLDTNRFMHCQPDERELASLYCHAQMLVYPSRFEGFGLPPLEAMTCRCPVVASDCSSIPEVTGDAAVLVDPEVPEAIAEAIDNVYQCNATRMRLVEAGTRQAAKFSWQRCVESHLRLYDAIS